MEKLKVLLLGASGMVGAAVLDGCLKSDDVESVTCLGRSPCGRQHPKLQEIIHGDLRQLDGLEARLSGFNACFFTLGISSLGMSEERYRETTQELTLDVARFLLPLNPEMAFLYVSGSGSDESETGKVMWARVKGQTENQLLALGFKRAVMIRLGGLMPLAGHRSRTFWIRLFAFLLWPLLWLASRLAPQWVTTPAVLSRAMIRAAQGLAPKPRLEPADLHELGKAL